MAPHISQRAEEGVTMRRDSGIPLLSGTRCSCNMSGRVPKLAGVRALDHGNRNT